MSDVEKVVIDITGEFQGLSFNDDARSLCRPYLIPKFVSFSERIPLSEESSLSA